MLKLTVMKEYQRLFVYEYYSFFDASFDFPSRDDFSNSERSTSDLGAQIGSGSKN